MRDNNWRKPRRSFSNGNCVEVRAWRKSTRSNSRHCVEAATGPGAVLVRDSKNPAGPVLAFGAGAWREFTARLRG